MSGIKRVGNNVEGLYKMLVVACSWFHVRNSLFFIWTSEKSYFNFMIPLDLMYGQEAHNEWRTKAPTFYCSSSYIICTQGMLCLFVLQIVACLLFHFVYLWTFLYEVVECIKITSQNVGCGLQLVRRLQGQDGEVVGEEMPATPKKIFQILNQVIRWMHLVAS